ncbi:NGG1p interacting factor 3 [Mycena vulgaris]|nr:NGG1p interacting factor 3 [Mycena vulgaris]
MSSFLTKAVCNAMQRIAPAVLSGLWDNVEFVPRAIPENTARSISHLPLANEAISNGVSMIVSYQTPIFSGLNPHSALDSVYGGINDWLATCIGAHETNVGRIDSKPATVALGSDRRRVTFAPPITMEVLAGRIKKDLGLSQFEVGYSPVRPDQLVNTVAICAGAGESMFSAMSKPADVWFTGEMLHHEVLAAVAAGTHVVLRGHTNTERGYLPTLVTKLRVELNDPAVDFIISKADAHPLEFV